MSIWQQNYDPLNNVWLSASVAVIPIIVFFLSLMVFKLKGYTAAFIAVLLATLIAIFVYHMPTSKALYSLLYGALFGLFPIGWIIIAAIFLYKLSIKSGYFEILKASIISITPDQRFQVILIAYCFGAFLEGAIGFGAPVAITAALLVGIGIKPIQAAGLCLIANLPPATYGAVGIPVTALADLVNVDSIKISTMSAIMLAPFSFFIPFLLVFIMNGLKGVKDAAPVCFVAGASFVVAKILTASILGPQLPDITAGVFSVACVGTFLKLWKPKAILNVESSANQNSGSVAIKSQPPREADFESADSKALIDSNKVKLPYSTKDILLSGAPFGILIVIIAIWTLPAFSALFKGDGALSGSVITLSFSELAGIIQTQPIVNIDTPVKSTFSISLINAVGTAIFLTAFITIIVLKVSAKDALSAFTETINEMKIAIFTICLVLAFAYISNYSGISATLALALSKTQHAFIFFSPIVGWLGVVLTGSVTSANLLFGSLQKLTANQLGVNEVLLLASNAVGGGTGKMISLQSIAVAASVVGLVGRESEVLRFTIKYSVILAIGIGIANLITFYFIPWIIPT
ncbi:L-lactate permease [Helicobacter saguini]|uniref:L-lactate permease n=1 Tax=Helicobacter saguini TaxID=1548018 RepID=A0A347VT33_9HELI|nr:lactate permease LctP family transporter [Helicobacter saguini]MWV62257.1 L-lactate permease [Helicobacter saguini]MWV67070.1 L-lactate permease [Helicobacter saguini]MWV69420.1 L-lactate permease [Helicobacter saguini]MWV71026.1 L-lactate permease [Helicobacter saguini]TLD95068.1 L-lactate permease [Helicobacter saguini]